ncbi:hypothetical protein C8Q75DRAFT_699464, partial [Abortiporus biennis]
PGYSPSSAAPSYAAEPADDEQRLDFVARFRSHVTPDGTFTKKLGGITVVLPEQEDDTSTPTYSRHGVVKGEVLLDDDNILGVSVKLEGREYLNISEGGSSSYTIFTETCILWKKSEYCPKSTCPSILPFRLPFPHNYRDAEDVLRPLPPTFSANFHGVPGLVANCAYTLSVDVTRPRLGSFKKHKTLSIPIRLHPRSRPYMPIASGLNPFFSTVKSSPGDWHQVISTMTSRESSAVKPIECHLFIPQPQIYAVCDTIPFHLQLRGRPSSLQALLSTCPSTPAKRIHSQPPPGVPQSLAEGVNGKPIVRVYLLRQISARVHGQRAWRNTVLGEGKIWPVQPHPPDLCSSSDAEQALDWEGEVKCGGEVVTGGFNTGQMVVKDFFVLELKPHLPHSSPLLEHQNAHPIRIVTD